MVPSAVALSSSAVPCQRALLAYLARSERMTVITYRPPESKKAIPVGFAPYRWTLVPSLFFCSHETSIQVPTSCSFSACCWLTALAPSKDSANVETVHAATVLRKIMGVPPSAKSDARRFSRTARLWSKRYHAASDPRKHYWCDWSDGWTYRSCIEFMGTRPRLRPGQASPTPSPNKEPGGSAPTGDISAR